MVSGYNVPYTLDGDPPLKSNRNVGKATWFAGSSVRPFLGACLLVLWLCGWPWHLAFFSGSVCGSGPVVCSWPYCVVWFRPPGLFLSLFLKEVTTQGTDPRTDLQAGIPKYVRFTWTWDRLLGIYSYIFPIVSSCVSDRNPHVYRLACCSTSRPAGRKTRSGSQWNPIVSNHVNGENRPAACESLWRKCHLLGYDRTQQEGQSGTLRQGCGRKRR